MSEPDLFSFGENTYPFSAGHRCDNRPCVNPAHLFLGTHQDNMRDMREKGRGKMPDTVGEANSAAKLTTADVREIRASTLTGVALARRYGVTTTTISEIRLRRTWAHVDEIAA